jgi:hypothetical protein
MRTNGSTRQARRLGWAVILPLLLVTALTGAVPTPPRWVSVDLPRHEYARLAAPQALVAQSGPERFTFTPGNQGASIGPNTFDAPRRNR